MYQLVDQLLAGRGQKLTAKVKVRLYQRFKQGKEKKGTSTPECP
jgi:hypothetical protein